MGVHDKAVYPVVKRVLGIPEDEPIFILRGQDVLAEAAIDGYQEIYVENMQDKGTEPDGDFLTGLDEVAIQFQMFKDAHPNRVKFPD